MANDTNITKRQRQQLRKLAGEAHEEELRRALTALAGAFDAWRVGEIGSADLVDRIHTFHDGTNRELYKRYNFGDTRLNVGRALACGLLDASGIPDEILALVQNELEWWQEAGSTAEDEA